jgi:hypothetical protein
LAQCAHHAGEVAKLDTLLLVRHYAAKMNASEKQFSRTRAALIDRRRIKKQSPSGYQFNTSTPNSVQLTRNL